MYRAKPKTVTVDGVRWYGAQAVAELLGDVHVTQAYALMRSGRIKATRRHDKVLRTTLEEINAYKQQRKFWKGLHGQGPRAPQPVALVGGS